MKNNKKTLVMGASTKPERYSNKAIQMLRDYNHEVVALAKRAGQVDGVPIQTEFPADDDIHTVTLYLGAKRQPEYYEQLINLKPERVIFNPGAENSELKEKLESAGIETVENCTLVMLRSGKF
ncbi:MAG: CoA-binding protein [Bacteroidota bacterium]